MGRGVAENVTLVERSEEIEKWSHGDIWGRVQSRQRGTITSDKSGSVCKRLHRLLIVITLTF